MASSFKNIEKKEFYLKKENLLSKIKNNNDINYQIGSLKSKSKSKQKSNSKDTKLYNYSKSLKGNIDNKNSLQKNSNNILANYANININVNNLIISSPINSPNISSNQNSIILI